MASLPWPANLPWDNNLYDVITLGSRTWPGLATVSIKRANKIDKKVAKGQGGAKLTFQGRQPASVDITIVCWDETKFDEFQQAIAEVEPSDKKDPKPLDIGHPIARMRNVSAIAIEELDGPEWVSKSGWWVLKIKACDFAPPTPGNATSTPSAAVGLGQQAVDAFNLGQRTFNEALAANSIDADAWAAGPSLPPDIHDAPPLGAGPNVKF